MKKPKIYIASAMVFRISKDPEYEAVIETARRIGWEVLDPRVLTDMSLIKEAEALPFGQVQRDAWKKANSVIFSNNIAAIASCDMLLAILNGMEPDSGTSFEIGFASHAGKAIDIFRDDFRDAGDNSGCSVNLMLQCAAEKSGGKVSRSADEIEARLRTRFAECS